MIKKAAIGGRRLKNDNRDVRSWTGVLDLRAFHEGQQYILAALYEILRPRDNEEQDAQEAWKAIIKVAQRKQQEYSTRAEGKVVVIEPKDET